MTDINKINPKPIERSLNGFDKPFETVYELKDEYKVPSYEEFMKDYQVDENLNYDDLSGGNVGEVKGYGPCIGSSSCSNFSLRIECHNWDGRGDMIKTNGTAEAWDCVSKLEGNRWNSSDWISNEVLFQCANLVRDAIIKHNAGQGIDGYIMVQGKFWGGLRRSYSY